MEKAVSNVTERPPISPMRDEPVALTLSVVMLLPVRYGNIEPAFLSTRRKYGSESVCMESILNLMKRVELTRLNVSVLKFLPVQYLIQYNLIRSYSGIAFPYALIRQSGEHSRKRLLRNGVDIVRIQL